MVMSQVIPQADPNFREEIGEYKEQVYDMLYNLNVDFDGRKALGDDPENFAVKNYGNNIVYDPTKRRFTRNPRRNHCPATRQW
jgi:hypothetical protein